MSASSASVRHARLVGGALLVVTFIGGAVSGAAIDRLARASASADPPVVASDTTRSEDRDRERRRRPSIFDQLGLAPEQRAKIDSILEFRRKQMDEYWEQAEPGARAILDSAHQDIRATMTPEQIAEYDRLRKERRERRRNRDNDDQREERNR